MPAGGTLVAARLYWGGSGPWDFDVELNGIAVVAESTFGTNFIGLDFFAAYADVTNVLFGNGDGNYTLSELDLTGDIVRYCANDTDFGGWSVTVIYEYPSLALNQINLFDGLEFVAPPVIQRSISHLPILILTIMLARSVSWHGKVMQRSLTTKACS